MSEHWCQVPTALGRAACTAVAVTATVCIRFDVYMLLSRLDWVRQLDVLMHMVGRYRKCVNKIFGRWDVYKLTLVVCRLLFMC